MDGLERTASFEPLAHAYRYKLGLGTNIDLLFEASFEKSFKASLVYVHLCSEPLVYINIHTYMFTMHTRTHAHTHTYTHTHDTQRTHTHKREKRRCL